MLPMRFQVCSPIMDMQELKMVVEEPPSWTQRIHEIQLRSSTVVQNVLQDCHSPLERFTPRTRLDLRFVPKTLVCHDFKGGYLDDKYLNYPNENILGSGYTFYNWSQIDIFVYFSHYFITVPPLAWINLSHDNGVKILGTIITENVKGVELCSQIFGSEQAVRNFVENVAKITEYFKLDGWLLNIENSIEKQHIDNLKLFVYLLTERMHELNPENLVIWYDSVTTTGQLQWQNQLNDLNRCFFDRCDGIYLNYTWNEKMLLNTLEMVKYRNLDVFVGIDVFGRNTFGGGMFNCFKAAEIIRRYNMSMALFAPGWTFETIPDSESTFEDFLSKDSAFWSSLWTYFYTHPIKNFIETDFYIGFDNRYYNLFNQKSFLSRTTYPSNTEKWLDKSTISPLKNNCSCIRSVVLDNRNAILLSSIIHAQRNVHHLFVCDIDIGRGDVLVSYSTRQRLNAAPHAKLDVILWICYENGAFRRIRLLANYKNDLRNDASELEVNPLLNVGDYRTGFLDPKNTYFVYKFPTKACKILEVGVSFVNGEEVYLCSFQLQEDYGGIVRNLPLTQQNNANYN